MQGSQTGKEAGKQEECVGMGRYVSKKGSVVQAKKGGNAAALSPGI